MTQAGQTWRATKPAEPSGAVATTAGVLALCAALFNLWGERAVVTGLRNGPHLDSSLALFSIVGALLAAGALVYGAVLLLRRDETGRQLLIITSGLLTVIALVALVCSLVGFQPDYGVDWLPKQRQVIETVEGLFGGLVGSLTALLHRQWMGSLASAVFPLAIFLAASSGHTARWVAYRPYRPETRDSRVTFDSVDR